MVDDISDALALSTAQIFIVENAGVSDLGIWRFLMTVRDKRWEDVTVSIRHFEDNSYYPEIFSEFQTEFSIYVRYDGMIWWQSQRMATEDWNLIVAEPAAFGILMDEMVKKVDGYMDAAKEGKVGT